jgi:type I restriction enzyme S subunit
LLYDYWFVQYDFPLSAAQAAALGQPHLTGQPYRSSGGPMVFDPQLKREIPEGWEVGDLEELCSMVRGVTYSKEDIRTPTYSNTIPILRATNVNNGIVDLSDLVYVTEDMPSEDQYLEKFDILVVMSSGSKAHIGKNALYCYDRKVAYGAFCSKVVPNPSSRFFVAVHMQSDPFKKYISNVCRGTSINNLTNAHITKHQLPIPPKDQLQEFEKTVSSFFETIACNHQQNQELTTLRDWLLPMLMNGQVRVGCSESAESRQKGGAK